MSQKKDIAKLTHPWIENTMDATSLPIMLDSAGRVSSPFPLSVGAKKNLLELIYKRKSGIITRQELIDVLYNQETTGTGPIADPSA